MRVRVAGTVALALLGLLSTASSGYPQTLPPALSQAGPLPSPGFVPPYEIMRTVRSAGFDPLAPPLREGTTYVLRATDFRGILMRVVVDARTGAIRDANRIVPGPGAYGPAAYDPDSYGDYGMGPPDEMPPPYYGPPPDYDASDMSPGGPDSGMPPPVPRNATHGASVPPLPRPRPAEIATRKPSDSASLNGDAESKPAAATDIKIDTKADIKPDIKDGKNDVKSETAPSASRVTPATPNKSPVLSPPIND